MKTWTIEFRDNLGHDHWLAIYAEVVKRENDLAISVQRVSSHQTTAYIDFPNGYYITDVFEDIEGDELVRHRLGAHKDADGK